MIAVLLVKNSAFNPENRSANMHIDARDIGDKELDKSLSDRGFILLTESEWERHLVTFKDEYVAWESLQITTKQNVETSKIDAFRQLFQDGSTIESNWASATNDQKIELGRITFRILWLSRTSLYDIVKPEAS